MIAGAASVGYGAAILGRMRALRGSVTRSPSTGGLDHLIGRYERGLSVVVGVVLFAVGIAGVLKALFPSLVH